jgi:hypothetical protein
VGTVNLQVTVSDGTLSDTFNLSISIVTAAGALEEAPNNPRPSHASEGETVTALEFWISETGGSAALPVTDVIIRITTNNTASNSAITRIASVTLVGGATNLTIANGGTGWTVAGSTVSAAFTGVNRNVPAGGTREFRVRITFSSGAVTGVPLPTFVAPGDVNGGSNVAGATVNGGSVVLTTEIPDDDLDDDDDGSDCSLAARAPMAWPMAALVAFVAVVLRRRARREA